MHDKFLINDNLIIPPAKEGEVVEIIKGPNIKDFPKTEPLKDTLKGKILLKVDDNITTDHIMPSNAKLLPYRSNIPYLSEYCFKPCDSDFPSRAKEFKGGFILGGSNYGQGSSREHAALAPLYLGIKAVVAKSFARIHEQNLINNGILPLTFENDEDYNNIDLMDEILIEDNFKNLDEGVFILKNLTKNNEYKVNLDIPDRQKKMILAGGLLNLMKENNDIGGK